MVSNQYDQFCVSGVSEHPVEAAHVVLPVLKGETTTTTQLKQVSLKKEKTKLPWEAREH